MLDDNRAQTLALAIARAGAADDQRRRYLNVLEAEGGATRPSSSCRPTASSPSARRPAWADREFSVLLAYQAANITEMERSGLPAASASDALL